MSIPFTQFLMPDGRQEQVKINRPADIETMAHKVIRAGYAFEIEMLGDYATISMEVINKRERVLSSALCHNGPTEPNKLGVPDSVDKIVREAFAKIPKRFQIMAIEIPEESAPKQLDCGDEKPF